jgi:hypothetical protein
VYQRPPPGSSGRDVVGGTAKGARRLPVVACIPVWRIWLDDILWLTEVSNYGAHQQPFTLSPEGGGIVNTRATAIVVGYTEQHLELVTGSGLCSSVSMPSHE